MLNVASYSWLKACNLGRYDSEDQKVQNEQGTVKMPILFDEIKQTIKE